MDPKTPSQHFGRLRPAFSESAASLQSGSPGRLRADHIAHACSGELRESAFESPAAGLYLIQGAGHHIGDAPGTMAANVQLVTLMTAVAFAHTSARVTQTWVAFGSKLRHIPITNAGPRNTTKIK
jgi:hypothetical protein